MDEQLTRIRTRDDVVRAWVNRHDDTTLGVAAAAAPAGLLRGWTLGVKDVIDTHDLPTERGSPIYAGRTTPNDASCVAVARAAGAVVVGKTVTTEFALFTPNITTNPHNPDHTPGGSSSGSAAAVADGHVRAAFGTQTVGSVIRPAAYCGVVGFKPTHQLVPLTGVATLSHAFDTVGWFTNSVADAATMLEALTGAQVSAGEQRLRLGCYRSHQWDAAAPETADILAATGSALSRAGVEVVDVDPLPHLETVFDAANTVLHYEVARVFAWEREHHYDLISPLVQRMLTRADAISHERYREAHQLLALARDHHERYMIGEGFDAILTPSAPGEAPPIKTTGDSVFNRVWTALGVPTAHVPHGVGPAGLPVGVQLVGRTWCDAELLAAAAVVEAAIAPR